MKRKYLGQIVAQILLIGFVFAVPFSGVYADDGSGKRNDLDACYNSQIISYTPQSGSYISDVDYIEYIVSGDTVISSLEGSINGVSYPVQYRDMGDGTYRARIVVPENVQGSVYVDMGAQSDTDGACNDLLSMSFILNTDGSYNRYGVRAVASPVKTVAVVPTTSPIVASRSTDEGVGVLLLDEENLESQVSPEEIAVADASSIADLDDEMTDEVAAAEDGLQTALIGAAGSAFGEKTCTTLGASWPWFVWLGFVWLYLIVLWLVLGYTVEPIFGQDAYARRLGWTVGLGTVAAIVFWWMANPCYTHVWVPVTVALLGVALYWLYSEEDHVDYTTPSVL